MAKRKTINFPEYAPDLSDLGTNVTQAIIGVIPRADGFGPFRSLRPFTESLPDKCRGAFLASRSDGSVALFAGTRNHLYLLNNTDFKWQQVSKDGDPYASLVTTDNWQFEQFNDLVIAVQVNTAPQVFRLSSSNAFVDLGGSPPSASFIAVINRFVVLTGLLSNPRRVQWCDLDSPEVWTAGVGLADFQDLPDGGSCGRVSGGDAYGVVFQDKGVIRTLTYAPGSAVTFQITRISKNDTLYAPYSVINVGEKTFFLSAQGFKRIDPGGAPVQIGKERVDRTFFKDVDTGNLQLVIGAADPNATRVYWGYKSVNGLDGQFDKILCYDWSIGDNGRFTLIPMAGQYISSLAKPGLTLEQLDALAPTQLHVQDAQDNGAGAIRLTLDAVANADFQIAGQNFIVVQGVTGTEEANGTWQVTIVDATHIDLIGSTYVNAYTGGGAIGGSLDKLPFSLDSISKASLMQLAAFGADGSAGFFDGDNIEAVMETGEQDLEGDMVFIDAVRPLTDSPQALMSLGYRNTARAAVVYSDEQQMEENGDCPALVEARYARARLRIPAGTEWTYARGIQPSAQLAGDS